MVNIFGVMGAEASKEICLAYIKYNKLAFEPAFQLINAHIHARELAIEAKIAVAELAGKSVEQAMHLAKLEYTNFRINVYSYYNNGKNYYIHVQLTFASCDACTIFMDEYNETIRMKLDELAQKYNRNSEEHDIAASDIEQYLEQFINPLMLNITANITHEQHRGGRIVNVTISELPLL